MRVTKDRCGEEAAEMFNRLSAYEVAFHTQHRCWLFHEPVLSHNWVWTETYENITRAILSTRILLYYAYVEAVSADALVKESCGAYRHNQFLKELLGEMWTFRLGGPSKTDCICRLHHFP